MTFYTWTKISSVMTALFLLLSGAAFGQTDIVKSEGITNPLHQANLGRIAFISIPIPVESLKETDFLKTFELRETGDLAFRAFMGNSLTNYLHRLAPELSVDELTRNGNYQFYPLDQCQHDCHGYPCTQRLKSSLQRKCNGRGSESR